MTILKLLIATAMLATPALARETYLAKRHAAAEANASSTREIGGHGLAIIDYTSVSPSRCVSMSGPHPRMIETAVHSPLVSLLSTIQLQVTKCSPIQPPRSSISAIDRQRSLVRSSAEAHSGRKTFPSLTPEASMAAGSPGQASLSARG